MLKENWKKLQNGSDIRGVALEGIEGEKVNLTPEIIKILGKSFAQWLSEKLSKSPSQLIISLGRDSRLSGENLLGTIATAISELGVTVYNFEMASTPAMFMSTIDTDLNCDGAIMLTASHLPFNRNGLKFFTKQGGLEKQDITNILEKAQENSFNYTKEKGNIINKNFMAKYADLFVKQIRQAVNHPRHFEEPLKELKIIVDAGNGAGGFFADKVLKPLGADITGSQFLEPDGTFPNHIPNPENPEAMASICEAVIKHKADFGIIFDTDVDRSAAVDSTGKELNRNRLIALISAIILQEHPQSTIVTDSITSEGLTKFIEQNLGGKHHRFKRGYKNVINEALRLNNEGIESWLAIETSGHAALKENYFLDDGAYLITKLLIELAKLKLMDKRLTELINSLEEPLESKEIRLTIKADNFKEYGNNIIEELTIFTNNQSDWQIVPNNYEGVRVSCPSEEEKGWFLLRLSLHDPVIPINIESNVQGGVEKIMARLFRFLESFSALEK
ncbi:phosphoglucomutase/phosphomannomutase alpha/beta/alpha domain I [Cyanobacterium stanieri PCC 7202]|uniref:Phosphoglucomutase/phosphomannomutase alpha/beta/alpha domain I n=1 Tax=Cyanobacterium stanieri (strain ATCC 29140 / PCC 7202) TaxID=292563 RepID=K9YL76_CYASC|nr:phosphoglucomutase/phosphomannomutase alpha/beta/alpha domain I [Cyanobacterium stanieri PCC 7202]